MKAKLKYSFSNCIYGSYSSAQYTIVKKVEDNYKALFPFVSCKDYIHEMICNRVHEENLYSSMGNTLTGLPLDKLQVVMSFANGDNRFGEEQKEALYSIKKYISDIEVSYGLSKTLVSELDCSEHSKTIRCFLFTLKQHYIKSPVLIHMFIAMIRTLATCSSKKVTKDNIMAALEQAHADSNVLKWAVSKNVIDLLFKEHDRICKDLTLSDIYPKKTQTDTHYHSGFGLVALQDRRMCSLGYSKNLFELLDENKIT
jgi:hypothetical protein